MGSLLVNGYDDESLAEDVHLQSPSTNTLEALVVTGRSKLATSVGN